jgi:hypothetical protein
MQDCRPDAEAPSSPGQVPLHAERVPSSPLSQAAWSDAAEAPGRVVSYADERAKRVLYHDRDLQLLVRIT